MNFTLRMRDGVALGLVLALGFSARSASAQDLQPPPPMDSSQGQPPPPPPAQQPQQPAPEQPPPPAQQQPLAPPPPSSSNPPPSSSTEQRLDESKQEDSGRGLEFLYLNAQGGYAYDALQSLSKNNPLQMTNTDMGGAMVGAEAGIRLLFFTLGVRFRYEMLDGNDGATPPQPVSLNIYQLDLVAGFHVQAGKWDPYVSVHGGFSAIGNVDKNNLSSTVVNTLPAGVTSTDISNNVSTKGGNVGLGFGADYYLVRFLSIGAEANFELIFLHRDPLPLPAGIDPALLANNPYYQSSGDAAGMAFAISGHLGLHL